MSEGAAWFSMFSAQSSAAAVATGGAANVPSAPQLVAASSSESIESTVGRQPWCCVGSQPLGRGKTSSSSLTKWLPERREPNCERVLVHVYDLGDSFLTRGLWNSVAKSYGAFHTGVEVYGREWLFGVAVHEDEAADTTGISWHMPKENRDHSYRETLSMGFTDKTSQEVLQIVEEMKLEWRSSTYNVLSRNCHDFSDCLCKQLCVSGLPPWVNSLAPTGAQTYEYFQNTDSGYDGGEALIEMWSSVVSGVYRGFGWEDKPLAHRTLPPQSLQGGYYAVPMR